MTGRRFVVKAAAERPVITVACCLCTKAVPSASEVYLLDAEWQRRFPTMVGTLACVSCAVLSHEWSCTTPSGEYVEGHIPAARPAEQDFDSWSHIQTHGSHQTMVHQYPWAALEQGAEAYVRWLADRPTKSRVLAHEQEDLREVLNRWDERHRQIQT